MKEQKGLKIGILLLIFILLIGGGTILYKNFKGQPAKGNKEITVDVVFADGDTKTHKIKTDEEYLRGALEQEKLIEGSESDFGLFVITVDGYTADDDKKEWWAFSKDGESLLTGVDETTINDGDHYEITLTVGY